MDIETRANLLGALRLGIGASLAVAPGFAGRIWIGPGADDRGARVIARALGARDMLVGARILQAGRDKEDVGDWLRLGYRFDAASAVASLVATKHLSPWRRVAMPLIAGTVGAIGYAVAQAGRRAP